MFCCKANSADDRATDPGPLPEPEEFEPNKPRMKQMVIIGDVTTSTARIWAKVPNVGAYVMCLSTAKFKGGGQSGDLAGMKGLEVAEYLSGQEGLVMEAKTFDDPHILNGTFEFEGLEADTTYYYILATELGTTAEGKAAGDRVVVGSSTVYYFKTAKEHYDEVTFAAYSCHDPYSTKADEAVDGAWPQFAKVRNDIDLVLGGGDQVYVDSNELGITDMWIFLKDYRFKIRERFIKDGILDGDAFKDYITRLIRQYYMIYWNFPSLRSVMGRVPTYMMWDDHEIMDGWGSLNAKERVKKLKEKKGVWDLKDENILKSIQLTFEAAATVYGEFQHSHNPGPQYDPTTNPSDFIWDYSFNRGDYHFFLLDMRGHHDCERDSDLLLGSEQHERLKAWLDSLEGAQHAFILSPVPVVHWSTVVEYSEYFVSTLKDDLMDAWQHPTNHDEREKLFQEVFSASHKYDVAITFVSGDVHCCSAYTLSDSNFPNARVAHVTASPISRVPVTKYATKAFAKSGHIHRKLDNGKGKDVKTTVYQTYCFGKAGICNFSVIKARGKELDVTFHWPGKEKGSTETAKAELKWHE